jgi:hypothetical protein
MICMSRMRSFDLASIKSMCATIAARAASGARRFTAS